MGPQNIIIPGQNHYFFFQPGQLFLQYRHPFCKIQNENKVQAQRSFWNARITYSYQIFHLPIWKPVLCILEGSFRGLQLCCLLIPIVSRVEHQDPRWRWVLFRNSLIVGDSYLVREKLFWKKRASMKHCSITHKTIRFTQKKFFLQTMYEAFLSFLHVLSIAQSGKSLFKLQIDIRRFLERQEIVLYKFWFVYANFHAEIDWQSRQTWANGRFPFSPKAERSRASVDPPICWWANAVQGRRTRCPPFSIRRAFSPILNFFSEIRINKSELCLIWMYTF